MRVFDLLTVALLAAALAAALGRSTRSRAWAAALLAGAVGSCAVHLGVEHSRWQMYPAYVVLAVSLIATVLLSWKRIGDRFAQRRRIGVALVVSGAIVLSLSVLASSAFPMLELPAPSGPYAVGTTQFHFVDASRPEMHTANPVDVRELMVRVWYPATADTSNKVAPYLPHAGQIAEAVNKERWPLGLVLSHLGLVPTHAFIDAPLSTRASAYPVLVFSHGLGVGYSGQNTVLLEELASRGYVIFSIDHAYDGLASVFPDGRVTTFVADAYDAKDVEPSAELQRDAEHLMNSQNTPQLLDMLHRLMREQPKDQQLSRYWTDVWSKDQGFVIDQIERLQRAELPSIFAGHLQVDRLGVFGMSFGGSATAVTCAIDWRCKAGINIDGFRAAAIENPPQRSPFMYFANGLISLNIIFLDRDVNDRFFLQVKGSAHYDYTDIPYFARLVKLTSAGGSIDTRRMLALTNTYVGAFFDRYLAGKSVPVLNGASADYPEVQLKARAASEGHPSGA
ncbi:MAG: alpha/beta hydrolase family protein [Gemmatimonadales bacterium]